MAMIVGVACSAVALVLALVVLPGRAWWETRVRSTLCAATHGGSAVSL